MKIKILFILLFFVLNVKSDSVNLAAKNQSAQVAKLNHTEYTLLNKNEDKSKNQDSNNDKKLISNEPCPSKCTCSLDGYVNCIKAGYDRIPSSEHLPANVKSIDLTFNQIKRLTKFDLLPNLKELIIRHNILEELEPNVFDSVPNLITLDLSFNQIKLPKNVLNSLEHLEILKLENCNLSGKFEDNFFEKNRFLNELRLDSNPIGSIGNEFFKNLPKLEYLDLTNTMLKEINISTEYPLDHLKTLNLSNNQLEYVPLFKGARNIEKLILDNNRIAVLNKESFMYLPNLKTLEISNNDDLMDIEELTFSQQNKLKRLVISNNNHLFLISQHAFYGAYNETSFSLEELILSKNSLHLIQENMLTDHWGKLKKLDLRMNPWNCDCHLQWLHKYKNLSYVNELKCKTPEKLTKKYLVEINSNEMICTKLIDSLLYDKLKTIVQGFVFILAFLVLTLAFILLYVIQDRPYSWTRMFGRSSSSTIYYTKANTKDLTKENPDLLI